jgi:hypothetical protein
MKLTMELLITILLVFVIGLLNAQIPVLTGCKDDVIGITDSCFYNTPSPLTLPVLEGNQTFGTDSYVLVTCDVNVTKSAFWCTCDVIVNPSNPFQLTDLCASCNIQKLTGTVFDFRFNCSNRLVGDCVGLDKNGLCIAGNGSTTTTGILVPAQAPVAVAPNSQLSTPVDNLLTPVLVAPAAPNPPQSAPQNRTPVAPIAVVGGIICGVVVCLLIGSIIYNNRKKAGRKRSSKKGQSRRDNIGGFEDSGMTVSRDGVSGEPNVGVPLFGNRIQPPEQQWTSTTTSATTTTVTTPPLFYQATPPNPQDHLVNYKDQARSAIGLPRPGTTVIGVPVQSQTQAIPLAMAYVVSTLSAVPVPSNTPQSNTPRQNVAET